MKFCYNNSFTFPKQSSYKMDLDFWNCFGWKKKTLSNSQRNTVKKMPDHIFPILLSHLGYTIVTFLKRLQGRTILKKYSRISMAGTPWEP